MAVVRILFGWVIKPTLTLFFARVAYAILAYLLGFDPAEALVRVVTTSPVDPGLLEAGRWLLAGLIALVCLVAINLWQRRRRQKSSPTTLIDNGSIALAGKVNAIMERALRYDFMLPLPAGDPFEALRKDLEDSTHPIWTDKATNQLRRDFLQHVGIVGSAHKLGQNAKEAQADRRELENYARKLMVKLKDSSSEESCRTVSI